jgi:hypothetical protein
VRAWQAAGKKIAATREGEQPLLVGEVGEVGDLSISITALSRARDILNLFH